MTSRRFFIFYLAVLFTVGVTLASAQQDPIPLSTTSSPPADEGSPGWNNSTKPFDPWHGKLYVVTVNNPGHRYNCHVQSISATSLTCAGSGLHSARTFSRDDVAALISPGHRDNLWAPFLILNSIAAGIIVAGCFVASAPVSIVLFVLGSLVALSFGAVAIGSGNFDTHDTVLYQRPNTPLTVHLR